MPTLGAKPSDLPTWATTGGTRVAPSGGQAASGWTVGQRPPAQVMNWLQGVINDWRVYFDASIDAINTAKLERDGSIAWTGTQKPAVTNTIALGDGTHVFSGVFVNNLAVFGSIQMDAAAIVTGSLIPQNDGTQTLGKIAGGSKRWDAFLDAVDVNSVFINTTVSPNIANVGTCGTVSFPFLSATAQTLKSNADFCYNTATPATTEDFLTPQQSKSLLACGRVNGATTLATGPYNAASVTNPSTGSYVIALTVPIPDEACVVITPDTFAGGGSDVIASANPQTSGTEILVVLKVFNPATPAFDLVNGKFHFAVFGRPTRSGGAGFVATPLTP